MFTVQPERLSEEAQRLEKISGRLAAISSMLNRMYSDLSDYLDTDSTDELMETLKKIDTRVGEEIDISRSMSRVLGNVSERYRSCEKRIISEAEEISLLHRNMSIHVVDMSRYKNLLTNLTFR